MMMMIESTRIHPLPIEVQWNVEQALGYAELPDGPYHPLPTFIARNQVASVPLTLG